MYCILHMIGSDAEREEQSALITHLREAFHMDDDKHTQGRTAFRVLLFVIPTTKNAFIAF